VAVVVIYRMTFSSDLMMTLVYCNNSHLLNYIYTYIYIYIYRFMHTLLSVLTDTIVLVKKCQALPVV